jgi:hypothetical protein
MYIQLGLLIFEKIFAFILVLLTHIETGTHISFNIFFCRFLIYSIKDILYIWDNHVISQKASSIENSSIFKVLSFK